MAKKCGVLRSDGRTERAIFIVDRTGIIRYVDVHNIDEQPDNEVLFGELAEIEGVEAGEIAPRLDRVVQRSQAIENGRHGGGTARPDAGRKVSPIRASAGADACGHVLHRLVPGLPQGARLF